MLHRALLVAAFVNALTIVRAQTYDDASTPTSSSTYSYGSEVADTSLDALVVNAAGCTA